MKKVPSPWRRKKALPVAPIKPIPRRVDDSVREVSASGREIYLYPPAVSYVSLRSTLGPPKN